MPLVFFAASYPTGSLEAPFFSRFHSLRIDERSSWACFAALHLARLHKQHVVIGLVHRSVRAVLPDGFGGKAEPPGAADWEPSSNEKNLVAASDQ